MIKGKLAYLTRPILVLGSVSFFTDIASEMLYPVMPMFLESIGFSVLLIGILEGIAETTAGLSKGYFGNLSDLTKKRLPFVQLGYGLSAIAKPLLAVSILPLWIFFVRTTERLGKGIRTGARDAMLSQYAAIKDKGKVFGFHRSMDTLGAVTGPLLALLILGIWPGQYQLLFLLAAIPGLFSIILVFQLKETSPPKIKVNRPGFFDFLKYYKAGGENYRHLVNGLLLFALMNSSDILLLLKMQEAGVSDQGVITVYIFYNLIFAIFSFPTGILADKIGIKRTYLIGLILYIFVYTGFALNGSIEIYWILFFLYGVYAAATDGLSKAWITKHIPQAETGTGIGFYTSLAGISAFFASSIAGLLWWKLGSGWAFGATAAIAFIALIYLWLMTTESTDYPQNQVT